MSSESWTIIALNSMYGKSGLMMDSADYVSEYPAEIVNESVKAPVGPDPDGPTPAEPVTMMIQLTSLGGYTQAMEVTIPIDVIIDKMIVSLRKGSKYLGPILITPFYFHPDSKTLHTACRRLDDPDPSTIDEVEW